MYKRQIEGRQGHAGHTDAVVQHGVVVGGVAAFHLREGQVIVLQGSPQAGLVPGLTRRTAFVADGSGEAITIANNRLDAQIARLERR